MRQANDKNNDVPDTTQKVAGTTSAFSAASTDENKETNTEKDQPVYREDGQQGRAEFFPGSTTQGGSNHGQGSAYLGPSSYKQGSERNAGTNYENETNRFAETGTQAAGENTDARDPKANDGHEGGTEAEHDEFAGEEKTTNEDGTVGIP